MLSVVRQGSIVLIRTHVNQSNNSKCSNNHISL